MKGNSKRDRTARLLRLQLLLWHHPEGLDIREIAEKCSICERTVYRDLEALESELEVPVWEEGRKRGVTEGNFLPPVSFTPTEAINVFLATCHMQNHYNTSISSMTSTFMKLNSIIPSPLRSQVQNIIQYIENLPKDDKRSLNFGRIAHAWILQRRIKIRYQEGPTQDTEEYTIDPYFIEPAAWGRGIYIIAYSHRDKYIRTFKVQHIADVVIEPEHFEIPSDFNVTQYLGAAWGMHKSTDSIKVKLRFSQRVSQSILFTILEPSQKMYQQDDGSIVVELNICNSGDFRSWILGFGDNVVVLEPDSLRQQILAAGKSIEALYS